VTDTLVHSINEIVPVATIQTTDGVLTGTTHHPIHVGDEWIHMGQADAMGVSLEDRFVSNFYNLEINGHNIREELPGMTYSYVVNDIVASGLITIDGILKTGRRALTEEMRRMGRK
jgi:hypothetical protein